MGMILAEIRNIARSHAQLKSNRWQRSLTISGPAWKWGDNGCRPRKILLTNADMMDMSSAKLQVRLILLKKIFFMIFFNNHLTTYGTIHCC
jgi:hypothetical protein